MTHVFQGFMSDVHLNNRQWHPPHSVCDTHLYNVPLPYLSNTGNMRLTPDICIHAIRMNSTVIFLQILLSGCHAKLYYSVGGIQTLILWHAWCIWSIFFSAAELKYIGNGQNYVYLINVHASSISNVPCMDIDKINIILWRIHVDNDNCVRQFEANGSALWTDLNITCRLQMRG